MKVTTMQFVEVLPCVCVGMGFVAVEKAARFFLAEEKVNEIFGPFMPLLEEVSVAIQEEAEQEGDGQQVDTPAVVEPVSSPVETWMQRVKNAAIGVRTELQQTARGIVHFFVWRPYLFVRNRYFESVTWTRLIRDRHTLRAENTRLRRTIRQLNLRLNLSKRRQRAAHEARTLLRDDLKNEHRTRVLAAQCHADYVQVITCEYAAELDRMETDNVNLQQEIARLRGESTPEFLDLYVEVDTVVQNRVYENIEAELDAVVEKRAALAEMDEVIHLKLEEALQETSMSEEDDDDGHSASLEEVADFKTTATSRLTQLLVSDATASAMVLQLEDAAMKCTRDVSSRESLSLIIGIVLAHMEELGLYEDWGRVDAAFGKYQKLLCYYIDSDADQVAFLEGVEKFCTPPPKPALFPRLLRVIYKYELVEPTAVLEWYRLPSSSPTHNAIRASCAQFVEWLRTKEREEDEEEDEAVEADPALSVERLCQGDEEVGVILAECMEEDGDDGDEEEVYPEIEFRFEDEERESAGVKSPRRGSLVRRVPGEAVTTVKKRVCFSNEVHTLLIED
ncbi:hypothetical protein SpCBS45565_g05244 [Spizellomyces sp. 'palustris']|nr:hypothetical protein SpCBS45565_g05244 [Spizellomyces sp. 'palustris']